MEKTKRPFLLAGLILIIIAIAYFAVSAFLALFYVNLILAIAQDMGGTVNISASLVTFLIFVLMALGVLAVIFASMGLSRLKLSPQEFSGKKRVIIASLVIAIIILVLTAFGLVSNFSIISLICSLVLLLGVVFTIVGLNQNKRLLADAENLQTTTENQEKT